MAVKDVPERQPALNPAGQRSQSHLRGPAGQRLGGLRMGRGGRRPVYPCTGKPQGLFEYKNRSTGLASTAGKYAAAFALGAGVFQVRDSAYARQLARRARAVYALGAAHPGVCQTAPARSPYFYEEDDWAD